MIIAMLCVASSVAAQPIEPAAGDPATTARERFSRVERIRDRLTLREKIGQLIMFSLSSTSLTAAERDAISRRHLGGVIIFGRNYSSRAQMSDLTAQIQRTVGRSVTPSLGALISVDQEGGIVKRFPDMPPWYSAPEMGRDGRKGLAFDQGRATGRALRSVGVNVNLAPVADLDLPPEHVMRERSFGANRYLAGRLARAFGEGMQRKNVAATAKHFPGLGGSTVNTDDGRGYVYRSKWELRNIDAVPFHKAVRGGFQLMMVGHAMYVNDGGEKPASMSHHIATRRLRREFDFKGVAISDDLGVVAWRFGGDVAKACEKTLKAGVDIALLAAGASTATACAQRIYRAVREDRLSKARVDQAVTRVLRLKRWLGLLPG